MCGYSVRFYSASDRRNNFPFYGLEPLQSIPSPFLNVLFVLEAIMKLLRLQEGHITDICGLPIHLLDVVAVNVPKGLKYLSEGHKLGIFWDSPYY